MFIGRRVPRPDSGYPRFVCGCDRDLCLWRENSGCGPGDRRRILSDGKEYHRDRADRKSGAADLRRTPDESERFPQLPEEAAGPEDAEQAEEQESASADGNALAQGENFSPREESGMDDLKSIGAFVPAEGVLGTVVVQTRPGQTYYKARRIGIEYTGGGWEQGNLSYLGRQQDLSGEELEQYLTCPDGLDRLESLCADWDTGSREAVSEQIDEALARAVYDTAPGPAPQDQDFAEYFLFENQRGFCVHFATTAAVIYRMCGYPSRYAEGYAIPPSAFVEREDGRYEARIDGTMGHAWCQVYDEAAGMWVDMEHTPAASVLFRTGRIPPGQIRRWSGG